MFLRGSSGKVFGRTHGRNRYSFYERVAVNVEVENGEDGS